MNPFSAFTYRRLLEAAAASPASATSTPLNSSHKPFDFTIVLAVIILFAVLFFLGLLSATISRYLSSRNESYVSSGYRPAAEGGKVVGREEEGAAAARSLPLVAYGKAGKRPMSIDECTICLSKFDEKETVKVIPYCGHLFHPKCIDMWLDHHVTCPLCRSGELFPLGEN